MGAWRSPPTRGRDSGPGRAAASVDVKSWRPLRGNSSRVVEVSGLGYWTLVGQRWSRRRGGADALGEVGRLAGRVRAVVHPGALLQLGEGHRGVHPAQLVD